MSVRDIVFKIGILLKADKNVCNVSDEPIFLNQTLLGVKEDSTIIQFNLFINSDI